METLRKKFKHEQSKNYDRQRKHIINIEET